MEAGREGMEAGRRMEAGRDWMEAGMEAGREGMEAGREFCPPTEHQMKASTQTVPGCNLPELFALT